MEKSTGGKKGGKPQKEGCTSVMGGFRTQTNNPDWKRVGGWLSPLVTNLRQTSCHAIGNKLNCRLELAQGIGKGVGVTTGVPASGIPRITGGRGGLT